MCVLFSGWDLNQKQSASNSVGLRNSLKAHTGVSMENTGKGRRPKGHGPKHAAQMLPQVEWWGLLWALRSALEPAQHLRSLRTETTSQVTTTASNLLKQMPKSNQWSLRGRSGFVLYQSIHTLCYVSPDLLNISYTKCKTGILGTRDATIYLYRKCTYHEGHNQLASSLLLLEVHPLWKCQSRLILCCIMYLTYPFHSDAFETIQLILSKSCNEH